MFSVLFMHIRQRRERRDTDIWKMALIDSKLNTISVRGSVVAVAMTFTRLGLINFCHPKEKR